MNEVSGCLVAIGYISFWYIAKAILEAGYFKDRQGAKRTLFLWLVSCGSVVFALGLTFLINYLG